MNKTVSLVNLWGEFEAKHPDAEIEDFCRHYLTVSREKEQKGELFSGLMPPSEKPILSKLISRLSILQMSYANSALGSIAIKHIDEFVVLNCVANLKQAKKTEIIYTCLLELSTGLNVLSSLLKQGFITEHEDVEDKRSKRVKITPEGQEVLIKCYEQLKKVNGLVFADLEDEDIRLAIQLLKKVDIKFSALWPQHKGKTIDEIIASMK